MDALIKHYSDHVTSKTYENPLLFWKCHEKQFPGLAKLAKKFLGVPASSAAVERMFNISFRFHEVFLRFIMRFKRVDLWRLKKLG